MPFPKTLLRCVHKLFTGPDATEDLAAVLAVADFRRPNLSRQPSLAYLAFLAGLPEGRFAAALKRLEGRGLVEKLGTDEAVDVRLDGLLHEVEVLTAEDQ